MIESIDLTIPQWNNQQVTWSIAFSTQWPRDVKFYEKKRKAELVAVLANLTQRYIPMLNAAPNSKAVEAGYLHHEPMGVVAIDQKGGGGNLQETRLYTYAEDATRTLWVITIGNKDEQSEDIKTSKRFVENLLQGPPPSTDHEH